MAAPYCAQRSQTGGMWELPAWPWVGGLAASQYGFADEWQALGRLSHQPGPVPGLLRYLIINKGRHLKGHYSLTSWVCNHGAWRKEATAQMRRLRVQEGQ